MATYFVASSGSNTAPYDTWAKAATSIQTALTAASGGTDIVVIQKDAVPTGDAEASGNVTYTTANSVTVISATNDGGSAYTYSAMGATYWLGNSTTARNIVFDGGADDRVLLAGLTFRTASTGVLRLANGAAGVQIIGHDLYLWNGGAASIHLGINYAHIHLINPTFRFGATGAGLSINGSVEIEGGSVSSAGSAPTALVSNVSSAGDADLRWIGGDLSHCTGTLAGNLTNYAELIFDRCKLGSGATAMAAQTSNPTRASAHVWLLDCSSGDTHGIFEYHNALGSLTRDTGIYYTGGAPGNLSWKIVTTANCGPTSPFFTPWIAQFVAGGGSAITPRFEVARDGSATAFTNAELFAQFMAKATGGSTLATRYSDGVLPWATSTAQDTGAGTGAWAGLSGTAWSGKVDAGTSLTVAEDGDLSGRVAVAVASATVYVHPDLLPA